MVFFINRAQTPWRNCLATPEIRHFRHAKKPPLPASNQSNKQPEKEGLIGPPASAPALTRGYAHAIITLHVLGACRFVYSDTIAEKHGVAEIGLQQNKTALAAGGSGSQEPCRQITVHQPITRRKCGKRRRMCSGAADKRSFRPFIP